MLLRIAKTTQIQQNFHFNPYDYQFWVDFPPNTFIPPPTTINFGDIFHPIALFHTLLLLGTLEYVLNSTE